MAILKINGNEKEFTDGQLPATLENLLDELKIKKTAIVAEIDGEIICREKYSTTRICDGQNIELVKFMGGG